VGCIGLTFTFQLNQISERLLRVGSKPWTNPCKILRHLRAKLVRSE
jgi:hypothetical protein